MTTRYKGVYVTFDRDIRNEDIGPTLNAIKMIKGVIDVTTKEVNFDDYSARAVVKSELELKAYKALQKVFNEDVEEILGEKKD